MYAHMTFNNRILFEKKRQVVTGMVPGNKPTSILIAYTNRYYV